MTKRAMVIRMAGDTAIGGAIMDGMRKAVPVNPFADLVHERERRYWSERIDDARAAYGNNPQPRGVALALLRGWALVWWGIAQAYRRLSAWNRGDAR